MEGQRGPLNNMELGIFKLVTRVDTKGGALCRWWGVVIEDWLLEIAIQMPLMLRNMTSNKEVH